MDHWLSANQFHDTLEIDFRHQEPAIDDHFQNIWKRSLLKALQRLNMKDWGYSSPHGLWEVRSEIRQYLSVERGIDIEEDQMVLTGGTQQAIDLISQVMLKKEIQSLLKILVFLEQGCPFTSRNDYLPRTSR
ncbi:hypothetical protein OE903_10085 [Bacillus sp. B6(2022)]|nr:hypothetical protein [Bacillus sp. B6(2022)]